MHRDCPCKTTSHIPIFILGFWFDSSDILHNHSIYIYIYIYIYIISPHALRRRGRLRGCEKRKRDPWETLKRIIKATIKGFLMSFHMRIAMFLPWMMEIACDTNCEGAPWFWLCEGFSKTQYTTPWEGMAAHTHSPWRSREPIPIYLFIYFFF